MDTMDRRFGLARSEAVTHWFAALVLRCDNNGNIRSFRIQPLYLTQLCIIITTARFDAMI